MSRILPITLLIVFSGAAHAMPIHLYSIDNMGNDLLRTDPGGVDKTQASRKLFSDTSHDIENQLLTWGHNVRPGARAVIAERISLALSDEPNLNDNVDEHAILFGNLGIDVDTEYNYSRHRNSIDFNISWILLDSFEYAITSTEYSGVTGVPKSINAAIINSYNVKNNRINGWSIVSPITSSNGRSNVRSNSANVGAVVLHGMPFKDILEIWFHPTANIFTRYSRTDGSLSRFNPGIPGWYGPNSALIETVPEPTSLALLSIGAFAGLTILRRRRAGTVVASKEPD